MLAIQRQTVTGVIDGAFRLYRAHFKALFSVSLIVSVPSTLGSLLFDVAGHRMRQSGGDGKLVLATVAAFLLVVVIGLVAGMFGMAASTRIASGAALGEPVSLKDGLDVAWKAFPALLGATLIVSMAAGTGMLFFIVPGVIIYLGFAFIAPVVVLEGKGALDAMGRSWELTRGRRMKIFATMFLYGVVVATVIMGLAIVGAVLGAEESLALALLQTFLIQAISAVATPVWYVAVVLLYYDARVEREAFDVQMLSRSLTPPPA